MKEIIQVPYITKCKACKKEFEVKTRHKQLFCSPSCRTLFHNYAKMDKVIESSSQAKKEDIVIDLPQPKDIVVKNKINKYQLKLYLKKINCIGLTKIEYLKENDSTVLVTKDQVLYKIYRHKTNQKNTYMFDLIKLK